jgi:hypothetical protein
MAATSAFASMSTSGILPPWGRNILESRSHAADCQPDAHSALQWRGSGVDERTLRYIEEQGAAQLLVGIQAETKLGGYRL